MTTKTIRYSQQFEKLFNFTRICAKICGVDMISDDYQMTWITWSLIGLVNLAILFTFYTMYVGVVIKNDWIEILKCLCMFCTGIQAYAKLINCLIKRRMLSFLSKEVFGIYTVYEQKSKNYQKLLKESIQLVKRLIVTLIAIVVTTCLTVNCLPFFYQIIFNERIFVMPFFFPYVNYESDFGYYFTSIFHMICVFFGVIGNFINDGWCFILAAHIPLIKNVLQAKFKELDKILEDDNNNKENTINDLLMDIFKWHQKYIIFCHTVENLFFWVIFVQVLMEFISIVCTIVCVFLGVWPAAPVFLIYSFALFYFHCALGNLVELSNDDIVLMIYDCYWYKLRVHQQKMILIMLREAQQAEGMSIGGIAPLSMSTALQLTKTIYTISMMLNNYFN